MATVWRSYNHRARLGIDVSVPTPGYGASSIVLTVNYYIQMEWNGATNNNASIPLSGAITGNLDQNLNLGNGQTKHLGTRTLTVNLTGSTQTRSFGIAATHFGPGWSGQTTYSPGLTVTIPARRTVPAPTGFAASRGVNSTNIVVSWGNPITYSSRRLERRVNGGGWSYLAAPGGTSYTDSTATPGNRYEYRIRGVAGGSNSAWTAVRSVTWTLAAPSGLSVSRSGSTASLSWSRPETVDSFRVEHRVNGGGWSQIAAPTGNGTSYSATGLVAGNRYEYRVRDVRKGVLSGYSNSAATWFPPVAPSTVTVARSSDTNHTITVVGGSARTSLAIHRQVNDGAWVSLATPGGNLSSWTDTSTIADRKYRYRVAIVTPGGQSGWVYSNVFYTTPRAPTGVTASRVGDDIRVSASETQWAENSNVQDDGTTVASATKLPWTHTNPNVAVTHRYRVQTRVWSNTSNAAVLNSAWSAYSSVVQLAAPPNAPINLSPNGSVVSVDAVLTLTWRHNPVDSSEQSVRQVRRRVQGASTWITSDPYTSDSQSAGVDPGWFTDGEAAPGEYEWQVRTRGSHPDWSPWSASATVSIVDIPVVTVTSPDVLLGRPTVQVEWGYEQEQGRPQSAWELELVHDSAVLGSRSGSGPTASITLEARAEDGETYTVRVRAATGNIWSEWAEAVFDVLYSPPAEPVGFGTWNEREGAVDLFVRVGEDEAAPETTQLSVERSVDGEEWVPVLLGDASDHSVTDGESLSNGVTYYRFTAFTFDGVTTAMVIEVESDSDALWISGGDGFTVGARLLYSPEFVEEVGREGGVVQFAGRERFWAWKGSLAAEVLQVSGVILHGDLDTAQISDVKRVFNVSTPVHLYRDPSGRRVYGSVSRVTLPRHSSKHSGYSFELTETDH